jgi:hypothetical protein
MEGLKWEDSGEICWCVWNLKVADAGADKWSFDRKCHFSELGGVVDCMEGFCVWDFISDDSSWDPLRINSFRLIKCLLSCSIRYSLTACSSALRDSHNISEIQSDFTFWIIGWRQYLFICCHSLHSQIISSYFSMYNLFLSWYCSSFLNFKFNNFIHKMSVNPLPFSIPFWIFSQTWITWARSLKNAPSMINFTSDERTDSTVLSNGYSDWA